MKVILKQDVKGVGQKGDVKEVAEGYARNYLLPRQLAVKATSGNMKALQLQEQNKEKKAQQELEKAQALAQKMESETIQIPAKAGESGRLFGAVTSKQIAQCLAKKNYKVDKRKITMDEPIRAIGFHHIPVKIHPQVTVTVKVQVVEEK